LTFLFVSLAYAWHCFYVPSNSIAWADDYATAQRQAVQSDKQIILFFTGEWCVPCRIMKRNVWADDLVAATVNDKFVPVMIDVDYRGAADALRRYNVGSTPKTIITDPDGNVLRQNEGGMSKAEFLGLLQPVNRSDSNDL
jgi:protein disulfide-isomerase